MCEHGNTVLLLVLVPAHLAFEGVDTHKVKDIDSCIAPLVKALNEGGMTTVSSCCGHGKQPTRISLADGREVFIAPDYETAQAVTATFPPIFDQEPE